MFKNASIQTRKTIPEDEKHPEIELYSTKEKVPSFFSVRTLNF
jgi:hypothetical protein